MLVVWNALRLVSANAFTAILSPICPLNGTLYDLTVIFQIAVMGLDKED
jgi:hypothetical protein